MHKSQEMLASNDRNQTADVLALMMVRIQASRSQLAQVNTTHPRLVTQAHIHNTYQQISQLVK